MVVFIVVVVIIAKLSETMIVGSIDIVTRVKIAKAAKLVLEVVVVIAVLVRITVAAPTVVAEAKTAVVSTHYVCNLFKNKNIRTM